MKRLKTLLFLALIGAIVYVAYPFLQGEKNPNIPANQVALIETVLAKADWTQLLNAQLNKRSSSEAPQVLEESEAKQALLDSFARLLEQGKDSTLAQEALNSLKDLLEREDWKAQLRPLLPSLASSTEETQEPLLDSFWKLIGK